MNDLAEIVAAHCQKCRAQMQAEPKLTEDQQYLIDLVGIMKERYGANRDIAPDIYQEMMRVHDRIEVT